MKKYLKILSIMLVLVLMTGCVKYNINMKIGNDKKMSMELIIAVSKNMKNMGEAETTQSDDDKETEKKLKDAGWKIEEYKDNEFEGSKFTKDFANIDELSTTGSVEFDLNGLVEKGTESKYMFTKRVEGNKEIYTAKFKADTSDATGTSDGQTQSGSNAQADAQSQAMAAELMKSMDLKFVVEVPKVVKSNATTTEGNKLTWDLTKTTDNKYIEFEFEIEKAVAPAVTNPIAKAKSTSNTLLSTLPVVPIAIGLGVVLLLIIVIALTKGGKKKEEEGSIDASSFESMPPVDAPTPVEEPTPVEAPTPVEEPAPVEASTPAEEPAPAEEPTPVEETITELVEPTPVEASTNDVVEPTSTEETKTSDDEEIL